MTISVVVPVLNAARTLPACLAALERLDPAPLEIIFVDNGSSDRSRELLHAFIESRAAPRLHLLAEPKRGAAAARNAGIAPAKGDVIAFTDSDCAVESAWLRHLAEPFRDPAVGAVAGRVVPAPGGSIIERFSGLYTLQSPDKPARHDRWTPWTGGYPTANLAVRRTLLQELNGFDESFMIYGEDYDLCARIYARGAMIAYTPAARVSHHHRTTLGGLLRQAFGFGRSHACLLRRHAARGLWMDLPGWSFTWRGCPVPAWVDLATADKKVLALLLLGVLYRPALLLLPLYALWLAVATSRRAARAGAAHSPAVALTLGGLLVLKSAAMTAGRWWGSIRYGTVCL